jgi:hypothetical protein
MARDALDPGPGNTYPAFPRDSKGRPWWSDSAETDGTSVDPEGVEMGYAPMPRGLRPHGLDVTPRLWPSGAPINPPVIPPP